MLLETKRWMLTWTCQQLSLCQYSSLPPTLNPFSEVSVGRSIVAKKYLMKPVSQIFPHTFFTFYSFRFLKKILMSRRVFFFFFFNLIR